jgi:hypothetical protein
MFLYDSNSMCFYFSQFFRCSRLLFYYAFCSRDVIVNCSCAGHFVNGPSFPEAPKGLSQNSWSEHELEATIDFARVSKIVNWITGGLNTHVQSFISQYLSYSFIIIEGYCIKKNHKKELSLGGLSSHFRYL